MTRLIRIAVAALIFAGVCVACTPATNGSGFLPSTHHLTPQDGGGGLPPSPKAIATRNP
jgi:hypothetical protein